MIFNEDGSVIPLSDELLNKVLWAITSCDQGKDSLVPLGTVYVNSQYLDKNFIRNKSTEECAKRMANHFRNTLKRQIVASGQTLTMENMLGKLRFVLLPYHGSEFHWYGLVMCLLRGELYVYDSMTQSKRNKSKFPNWEGKINIIINKLCNTFMSLNSQAVCALSHF